MPDQRLARKFHRAVSAVRSRRIGGGIRAFNPSRHFWTAADDRLLGTRPDDQVAIFGGATVKAVVHRRAKLKIPPAAQQIERQRRSWTEDALLGTAPDAEIAHRLGRHTSSVQSRRLKLGIRHRTVRKRRPWTPEEDARLGTAPETEIAARLGRQVATVCIRRKKLGIPNACRHSWRPEDDKLLGTRPDDELARRFGCSVGSVKARRQFLRRRAFHA